MERPKNVTSFSEMFTNSSNNFTLAITQTIDQAIIKIIDIYIYTHIYV